MSNEIPPARQTAADRPRAGDSIAARFSIGSHLDGCWPNRFTASSRSSLYCLRISFTRWSAVSFCLRSSSPSLASCWSGPYAFCKISRPTRAGWSCSFFLASSFSSASRDCSFARCSSRLSWTRVALTWAEKSCSERSACFPGLSDGWGCGTGAGAPSGGVTGSGFDASPSCPGVVEIAFGSPPWALEHQ